MISLKVEDQKDFTKQLFIGDTFDRWLVHEAVIVTFNTFTIDGRIRPGYDSPKHTEEAASDRPFRSGQEQKESPNERLSSWKTLKPFCFSLIRGKRLPESFRISFQLSSADTEDFLARTGLAWSAEQIGGLCLNVRYENRELCCVSGLSLRTFTLDRQVEYEWDEAIRRYLKTNHIPFSEKY